MSVGVVGLLLNLVNGPVGTAVEKYFDNKDQADAFKNAVELEVLKNQDNIAAQAGNVILAEAQSESWITASWRPLMMMVFVAIVAINLLVVPYFIAPLFWVIGIPVPEAMAIPDQVWTLLSIGIGGYVGGRSVEKAAKSVAEVVKKKKNSVEDY